ncbi:MAG: hypothetical protein ACREXT_08895, partial [Gammaproteobacteria bacterium]
YIDNTAFDNQVAALVAVFRSELGEYFGTTGLEVKVEPIRFAVDEGVYAIQIGPTGKKMIARADVGAKSFSWWSAKRAETAPIAPQLLDRWYPLYTGDAPAERDADLHLGYTIDNRHKAAGGTAILCTFEFRGQEYPDRGKSK